MYYNANDGNVMYYGLMLSPLGDYVLSVRAYLCERLDNLLGDMDDVVNALEATDCIVVNINRDKINFIQD
jgi:hypothetical protein